MPAEVWIQSGRAHEVVRGHLEAEPLIEPASLDAAKCTHYLDRLSVVPRRSLERDVDQPFANSLRPVGFVDDQRVDRDEVPGPLELPSRRDGNNTNDIVMELGDHDVRRRRCRELSDDVLRWDDPSELIEQLADAGRVLRHRWAQRHVHAASVRGTDCPSPGGEHVPYRRLRAYHSVRWGGSWRARLLPVNDDGLLAEQRAYYRARAPDYAECSQRRR